MSPQTGLEPVTHNHILLIVDGETSEILASVLIAILHSLQIYMILSATASFVFISALPFTLYR